MDNTIIARRTVGYYTNSNVVWGVEDVVIRRSERHYDAVSSLDRGTKIPNGCTVHRSPKAALAALGLREGEDTRKLAADWACQSVHGVTGQVYEVGTLEAGALVRNERAVEGIWELEASTDGGEHWFTQRGTTAPFTR